MAYCIGIPRKIAAITCDYMSLQHFRGVIFACLILNMPVYAGINDLAESYVKLVLETGLYDPDYADAYYGPPEWKPSEDSAEDDFPAQKLEQKANDLIKKLDETASVESLSTDEHARYKFLKKQLVSVKCKIEMLDYEEKPFDEESKLLYDIVAPPFDMEHCQNILNAIDEALPGEGGLNERLNKYNEKFLIPSDKIQPLLKAAIAEYRRQTAEHITLPANEKLEIEFVTHKPWSANLEFKGNSSSVMQINTSNPFYFWDIITMARHEGYPGHHVHLVMLEKNLYKEKNWVEFSVLPLNSPLAFITEGLAEYGRTELLGVKPENMNFERDVLFPMAGLNPSEATKYFEIMALKDELDSAAVEAARQYLDGNMSIIQAQDWIEKYCLTTFAGAGTLMNFIQTYRSYVINYTLGKDIVENYIEKNTGKDVNPDKKWETFTWLILNLVTPSDLETSNK